MNKNIIYNIVLGGLGIVGLISFCLMFDIKLGFSVFDPVVFPKSDQKTFFLFILIVVVIFIIFFVILSILYLIKRRKSDRNEDR